MKGDGAERGLLTGLLFARNRLGTFLKFKVGKVSQLFSHERASPLRL